MISRPRCRNLILTNQPRLYFTSTEAVDGKEDMYLSDIMLFSELEVKANKAGDMLTIYCPISMITYQLKTNEAAEWSRLINESMMEHFFE